MSEQQPDRPKIDHSGACGGYQCHCKKFVKADKTAGGWVYCTCRHTELVHRALVPDSAVVMPL